jgi:hypothetical protein
MEAAAPGRHPPAAMPTAEKAGSAPVADNLNSSRSLPRVVPGEAWRLTAPSTADRPPAQSTTSSVNSSNMALLLRQLYFVILRCGVGIGIPALVGLASSVLVASSPCRPAQLVGQIAARRWDHRIPQEPQQFGDGDRDQCGHAGGRVGVGQAVGGDGDGEVDVGERANRAPTRPRGRPRPRTRRRTCGSTRRSWPNPYHAGAGATAGSSSIRSPLPRDVAGQGRPVRIVRPHGGCSGRSRRTGPGPLLSRPGSKDWACGTFRTCSHRRSRPHPPVRSRSRARRAPVRGRCPASRGGHAPGRGPERRWSRRWRPR